VYLPFSHTKVIHPAHVSAVHVVLMAVYWARKNLAPAHLFSVLLTENMFIIHPDSTGKKGVAVPAASSSAAAAALYRWTD
jgi:hypothetical protein